MNEQITQVKSMTVGKLISILRRFDESSKVKIGHDRKFLIVGSIHSVFIGTVSETARDQAIPSGQPPHRD